MSKFFVKSAALAVSLSLGMALCLMASPVALAEETVEEVIEEEEEIIDEVEEEEEVVVDEVEEEEVVEVTVPKTGDVSANMAVAAAASLLLAGACAAFVMKKSR